VRFFVFFLVVLSLPTSSFADERDDKWALSAEIVGLTTTDSVLDGAVDAIWPMLEARLRANNPDADEVLFDDLREIFRESNAQGIAQVSEVIVTVFAREFSLAELKELHKFYTSDAGRKLIVLQPKIAQELMPVLMVHMQQMMPRVIERMLEEAEQRGLKVDV